MKTLLPNCPHHNRLYHQLKNSSTLVLMAATFFISGCQTPSGNKGKEKSSQEEKSPKPESLSGTYWNQDKGIYKALEFKGKSTVMVHTFFAPFGASYSIDGNYLRVDAEKRKVLFKIKNKRTLLGEGFAKGVYVKGEKPDYSEKQKDTEKRENSEKSNRPESSGTSIKAKEEGGNDQGNKEEEKQEVSEELKEAREQFKGMKGDEGKEDLGMSKDEDSNGGRLGTGGRWKLSGRKIIKPPQPDERPDEEGKVVLDIWVDPEGNVVKTSPNLSESNTTSDQLLKIAEEAAKKAKFNKSEDAPSEQKGTFTFVFEIR